MLPFVQRYLEDREHAMHATVRWKMGMEPEEEGRRVIHHLLSSKLLQRGKKDSDATEYPNPHLMVHVPLQLPFEPPQSAYFSLDPTVRHVLEDINEVLVKINNILLFQKYEPLPPMQPMDFVAETPKCECGLNSCAHFVRSDDAYYVCAYGLEHPMCNFMQKADGPCVVEDKDCELLVELLGFQKTLRALYFEITRAHSSYYSSEEDFQKV